MTKNSLIKFKVIFIIIGLAALAFLILFYTGFFKKLDLPAENMNTSQSPTSTPPIFTAPISNWQARVTKKPFGIYITPQTSPIQPERFSGYHTGVDFETFVDEQNIDVPVCAVCDGKLLTKRTASGYGGIAVQACRIGNQDVTVIYGHLRLSSISVNVGDELRAGDKLAVLGAGYIQETDGERKHLHIAIYRGAVIDLRGYVQIQEELEEWIDVIRYLK